MKKVMLSIALLIALTFSAYAETSVNLYNEDVKYEKTDAKTIKVFRQQPEGKEFVKMGEIVVSKVKKMEAAEKQLKKKASEIGADAVYIIDSQKSQSGYVTMSSMILPIRKTTITAIAIKYKDSSKP